MCVYIHAKNKRERAWNAAFFAAVRVLFPAYVYIRDVSNSSLCIYIHVWVCVCVLNNEGKILFRLSCGREDVACSGKALSGYIHAYLYVCVYICIGIRRAERVVIDRGLVWWKCFPNDKKRPRAPKVRFPDALRRSDVRLLLAYARMDALLLCIIYFLK